MISIALEELLLLKIPDQGQILGFVKAKLKTSHLTCFYCNKDGKTKQSDGGLYNILLYSGLGMIMVGLIITVVGLGDKGFKSIELILVGPGIVMCGGVLTSARVLLCTLPSTRCGRWCGKRWPEINKDYNNTEETVKKHSRHGLERPCSEQPKHSGEVCLSHERKVGVVGGHRQIIKPVKLAPQNKLPHHKTLEVQKLEVNERGLW